MVLEPNCGSSNIPNIPRLIAASLDDVERAKAFYSSVFGWASEEWGPPDFYLIQTGTEHDRGIRGALQLRTEFLSGTGMIGYECSISVEDLNATANKIEKYGSSNVVKKVDIPTVGRLVKFAVTEGNVLARFNTTKAFVKFGNNTDFLLTVGKKDSI